MNASEMIEWVARAASTDEARDSLLGLYHADMGDGRRALAATDGHRIHVAHGIGQGDGVQRTAHGVPRDVPWVATDLSALLRTMLTDQQWTATVHVVDLEAACQAAIAQHKVLKPAAYEKTKKQWEREVGLGLGLTPTGGVLACETRIRRGQDTVWLHTACALGEVSGGDRPLYVDAKYLFDAIRGKVKGFAHIHHVTLTAYGRHENEDGSVCCTAVEVSSRDRRQAVIAGRWCL